MFIQQNYPSCNNEGHKINEFTLKTSYFSRKFNLGAFQVKDALIRLEKLRLIKREFRTIIVKGRKFSNEMFLILDINNIFKLTAKKNQKKFPPLVGTSGDPYEGISSYNIDKKEAKEKNRSNFADFNLSELKSAGHPSKLRLDTSFVVSSFTKKLSDFHPLSKCDAGLLQIKSGRDFDLNFINQLILRLADKYPDRRFNNKKSVISYMSKLLTHELRQAAMVNNPSFKFKDNQTLPATRQYLQDTQENTESLINLNANKPLNNSIVKDNSIWEKVRAKLISYYGEAVDRSWFSKLIPEENSEARLLNIKAPNFFLRDWVQNNYQTMIRVFCEQEDYCLGQFS